VGVEDRSAALKRMLGGECPGTPEEWRELGEFLASVAKFLGVINLELDYVGHALDVTEPILEILADASAPETKALLKEVIDKHEQESHGLHVSEVQEEDGGFGGDGPLEPGGGESVPREG
jgi:hypothetical protein